MSTPLHKTPLGDLLDSIRGWDGASEDGSAPVLFTPDALDRIFRAEAEGWSPAEVPWGDWLVLAPTVLGLVLYAAGAMAAGWWLGGLMGGGI